MDEIKACSEALDTYMVNKIGPHVVLTHEVGYIACNGADEEHQAAAKKAAKVINRMLGEWGFIVISSLFLEGTKS